MLRKTLILTLLLTLFIAGCGSSPTPSPVQMPMPALDNLSVTEVVVLTEVPAETISTTFVDGLGREITLTETPQRIVSLAPSITEILFAVGAGDQVVGRDEYSDYPEAAISVESIGSTYQALNTEAILALEPDLVVAAEINSPEQIKTLEDLGITVYFFRNPTTFEGMYQDLNTMGQLTRHEIEANELVASLQTRVDAVTHQVDGLTETPKVFYEIDSSNGTDKPWTSGPGTFTDTLITMAGGINIGGVLSDAFAQISLEEIVLQDPDVIVLGDAKWGVTVESVGERPGWGDLSAVKNAQIFPFDDDLATRPGPRLVDGLEALFAILHPELIPVP